LPEGGRKTKLGECSHRAYKVRHADQHERGTSIHGVSPNRFPTKIIDFEDACPAERLQRCAFNYIGASR
jgi:hypothetical protein